MRENDIRNWVYRGPEAIKDPPLITKALDVYAWAIIFIEMLNQESPWKNIDLAQLINLHD